MLHTQRDHYPPRRPHGSDGASEQAVTAPDPLKRSTAVSQRRACRLADRFLHARPPGLSHTGLLSADTCLEVQARFSRFGGPSSSSSRASNPYFFSASHCQITTAVHPSPLSAARAFASRVRFGADLLRPEFPPRLRRGCPATSFMTVPEATMHKQSYSPGREHQIGRAGQILPLKAKAVAQQVSSFAHPKFRPGIRRTDPTHVSATARRVDAIRHLRPLLRKRAQSGETLACP